MDASPLAPPRWYAISLRPSDEHQALRELAARSGGGLIALSPWSIRTRDDPATLAALDAALEAPVVVATSPAVARALAELRGAGGGAAPSLPRPGQSWYAVGAGTAEALQAIGVAPVRWPARMDSEGLLALPGLQAFAPGTTLGLLTAPGGRGLIAPALGERGARVLRADLYERVPTALAPSEIARLQALDAPAVLALSSAEALQRVLEALPPQARARLLQARVRAASARLAELAREAGFAQVEQAAGPAAAQLLAGLERAFAGSGPA